MVLLEAFAYLVGLFIIWLFFKLPIVNKKHNVKRSKPVVGAEHILATEDPDRITISENSFLSTYASNSNHSFDFDEIVTRFSDYEEWDLDQSFDLNSMTNVVTSSFSSINDSIETAIDLSEIRC